VLLNFYCTLVDLRDPVRSRGSDDLARRLGLLLGSGEFYRRYAEMISSEPGGWRFWLCAVPDVVAGGGPPAARAVRPRIGGRAVRRLSSRRVAQSLAIWTNMGRQVCPSRPSAENQQLTGTRTSR